MNRYRGAIIAACVGLVLASRTRSSVAQPKPSTQPKTTTKSAAERPIEAETPRASSTPANKKSVEDRLYLKDRARTPGATSNAEARILERLLGERERVLATRRAQAVALLEEFVNTEPEHAPEMSDALLRLAELRWELARVDYLKAFAAWQKAPPSARSKEPPKPDFRSAIALYDRILTRHPDFERYDLVLYMKAFALVELGRLDESLVYYKRILADFPKSRFVPDAHMAVAEASFVGGGDYASALTEYEKVMRYQESELYDLALFKSAWCLWRMGRTKEAATRFRQVLDLGQSRKGLSHAQRQRLRDLQNEALDYLIQVFTEDEKNTAADIHKFLAEIGGEKYAERLLVRLSATFFDQTRYDRGVEAYRLLLKLNPDAEKAPFYQQQIALGMTELGDNRAVVLALEALAALVSPGSSWSKKQADPEVVNEARRLTEETIRTRAVAAHQLGQRDKQVEQFKFAVELYGVYLRHFPKSPKSYEIRFYTGEILFHRLGRYSDAGDAYLAAARSNPKGKYTRDALYNAIAAFEKVREQELGRCTRGRGGAGASPSVPEGPCGESDNDKKFSEAIEKYVELFPTDPDIPEILFRQGRLYYDRGVYDPAVRLFGQLLEKYPTSRFATAAGELILESFNRAKDYGNIDRWARRLKKAPAFKSPESQRKLNALILQAAFKVGEQLAETGRHAEAADAYYRAADEFPSDERARKAYYNAGVESQRAGDLEGATKAYDRLIDRYPGSTEGAQGAWAAAQMYESIALFGDAARYYSAYGDKFPRGEKSQDALFNAVLLNVTAGEHSAAIRAGQQFIKRYPKHESADDVYFLMGKAHEQAERWADAVRTYREFINRSRNPDRKIEAQVRLAQVLAKTNDRGGEAQVLAAAASAGRGKTQKLADGRYYLAQARYMQGDQVLADFEAVSIAGEASGLKKRLERKSELLKKAALIYADVVEFRVAEWATAALFKIGRSYELFAEALRSAPSPKGLSADEEQSYRDQLSMFIVPIEEKALEAYEGGYRKALDLHIYNHWTQKLREGLTRLNDVEYPPVREIGGDVNAASPLAMPLLIETLERHSTPVAGSRGKGDKEARRAPRDHSGTRTQSSKHAAAAKASRPNSRAGGAP